MNIELLVVGKTDSKEVEALVELYARRVNRYCRFAVTALPDVRNTRSLTQNQQRTAEGEAILRQLAAGDHVVLLDERGDEMRSVEFAYWLQKRMLGGVRRLVLVIGGPYGFSDAVYARADGRLSLSRMTFSHQIVRAIFAEQPHRPAIAVVTPSILTGLGLESILRRIIPMAEVEVYDRFERFAADRPDRFFHYFVASQTFVEHNAFFLERRHKSILLTDGAPQSTLRELHCLDIAQSEEGLVRDILRLHQHAHREGYPDGTAAAYPATHPTHPSARSACDPHGRTTDETVQPSLTQREIDVLRLVVAGLLNKQIAQRLDVALTTVISHRRNLVRKLGIRSVAGLTIYAVTKGYVDAEQLGEQ